MTNANTEPTLAATREAAEAVRAANYAAYDAPKGDTANVYDRAGALYQLLLCTQQATDDLRRHAARLATAPGLTSTSLIHPAPDSADQAAQLLAQAADHIATAHALANDAWSELSSLYIQEG